MKQTPEEAKIQERLKPGVVTLDGFLGRDNRHYHDIVSEDLEIVKSYDKTKEELADKMQELTDRAFEYADDEVTLDEIYRVRYQTERGKIVSPFMDKGLHAKGVITLHNLNNGLKVAWTPLHIDMIRRHGFFEGKGAKHRIDPSKLIKALFDL